MVITKCVFSIVYVQFKCENGRIILCLKNHEWNKSAISSMFKQVSSSADFVETWESDIITPSTSLQASRRLVTPFTEMATASTETAHIPPASRKRTATSSFTISPTLASSTEIPCAPPTKKRSSLDGIDLKIELCRKGINM